MFKKAASILLIAAVALGPCVGLTAIAVVMNPAAKACASTSGSLQVGAIPDSLMATTSDGKPITLNRQQLTRAATIITTGSQIDGVGRDGIVIALMAALTESRLRMLANTRAYPESATFPNDGDGGDHDSLGLFQMRPQAGWGTVAQLMDPTFQAKAFYGGPTGPNYPSPRGLLDVPGWQRMTKDQAAQAVEASAFPDRYQIWEPVADTIVTTLTTSAQAGESSRIVFPLPDGTWVKTSDFGPRIHPITGVRSMHTGVDFAAPDGTPILAVADGVVQVAEYSPIGGGQIIIDHTIAGQAVATGYRHMWAQGIAVTAGQLVHAGQQIGQVGNSGRSTGPHLHLEVHPGGATAPAIDPVPWLDQHQGAAVPNPGGANAAGCTIAKPGEVDGPTGDPDRMVDDPTSKGQITARMAHLMTQAKRAFPATGWACWSPRPGTRSEHPLGRACDITVGNRIGTRPTPAQLEVGWQLATWLQDHASTLGVEYLIWQGKIWSLTRSSEGWRPYNGGGMHDPDDVTGGHYDHIHVTVKQGAP